MTLQEAIKILNDYKMESAFNATPDFEGALKLLIEAGKAVILTRQPNNLFGIPPLPGETR